jgi:hypothetical protein
MQLFDWNLIAGQSTKWYGAGRFLRLVECVGTITIEAEYEAPETDRISSKLIRGIGVDLSHPDSKARMKSIAFISPVDQTITVMVSEFATSDSRLSGDVTVGAGVSLLNGVHTALANAGTDNIAANPNRRAIIVGVLSSATGSLFVGQSGATDATHGIEIQPGMTYRLETTAALSIYNASGAAQTYYVVEEL